MGNQQKQTETTQHGIFGKTNTFQVNNQRYHTVGIPIKQIKNGQKFIQDLNLINNFTKKHLLIGTQFKTQKSGLCGDSGLLNTTFPYFPFTLQSQIQTRRSTNKFLSKQQLINIIYQIIQGGRNFDRIDNKLGDIRPGKILLNQSKRQVKLINHFTTPNQLTGLQRAVQNKEKTLLAPEQLKSLTKNVTNPEINVHKADSFSLGLTILAIGNLRKMQDQLYDFTNTTFSWTQLSIQLQNFQRRYGHFLAQIIKAFVHNQPRNRLYIGQIGAILQFYEKHIYQFVDFQPDYTLMQKSYDVNYSGLKSQGFITWLTACRAYTLSKQAVLVQETKKVLASVPLPKRQVTVLNSNVRFTYVSPNEVTRPHENQQK